MKFLTKINRQYVFALSILSLIVSVIGYFSLKEIINKEVKEDIYEKEYAIVNEIKTKDNTPNIYPIIETKKITKQEIEQKSYKNILLYDEAENEEEPYLEYTNTVLVNNQYYLIKLRHSLVETEDLIMAISLPLFLLLLFSLVILYLTTKRTNKTIWKDFEENLKIIESFSFDKKNEINLKETDIEEFNRLNNTITELTLKLQDDYQSLKEFSENASHEIQTPISIISLNLQEILQHDLSETVFKQIIATNSAVKRLSNLNKNLLLLTKIKNKQYSTDKSVTVNSIIQDKIEEFKPLLNQNNINVVYNNTSDLSVKLNPNLLGIMLNNLISNAIKHNVENGEINIDISEKQLQICNTGKGNTLTNKTIFRRFTKENSHSYGLGLSIVKEICDTHQLSINYIKNGKHCFIIIPEK